MTQIIKVDESFLNLAGGIPVSESIKKVRYEDYLPQESSENFNRDIALNIKIDNIDNFLLLENSCFVFDIELQKSVDNALFTTGNIALANNALMYLFDRVQLRFDDKVIEEYTCAGQTTTVQGLLKYNEGFSNTQSQSMCWSVDKHDYSSSDKNMGFKSRKDLLFTAHSTKGKCRFVVPFNHIFGFEGKILSGVKVSIQFHRRVTADCIYKSAAETSGVDNVADGKVVINGLKWRIPYIDLNLESSARISEYLASRPQILYSFRTKQVEEFIVNQTRIMDKTLGTVSGPKKITGIVVCFQTDRANNHVTHMPQSSR